MKCNFCGAEMEAGIISCPACGKELQIEDKAKKICPKCNAEAEDDSAFCKKCGWDFKVQSAPEKFCPNCGAGLERDAKFCSKCGCKFIAKQKKKRYVLLIVIIVAAVLAAGAGGTLYYLHQREVRAAYEAERQRIHSYQSKCIELYDEINEAKYNFEILSTMFGASTEMNTDLLGPSFFTSYAEGLCSDEIEEEKSRKRDIDDIYEELKELECSKEEIQELKKAIEDYYFAYCDRYDILVEINFTTSNFSLKDSSSQRDFDNKFSAAQKEINAIDRKALEGVIEERRKGGATL